MKYCTFIKSQICNQIIDHLEDRLDAEIRIKRIDLEIGSDGFIQFKSEAQVIDSEKKEYLLINGFWDHDSIKIVFNWRVFKTIPNVKNYTVVIESEDGTERDLIHFETDKEAREFCNQFDWLWRDENDFYWEMCIRNN